MTPLVDAKTFKLKLFKEFPQGPAARKSRRLIGGKATAIDPHAHRFAASEHPARGPLRPPLVGAPTGPADQTHRRAVAGPAIAPAGVDIA
jgi:hypothetical protein